MLSVPIELPAEVVPLTMTLPMIVPLPASVPSAPTVVSLVMEPFMASVPALIVLGPV